MLVSFAPAGAEDVIDPALCRVLTRHVPDADIAFRPGVDAHGRPVAPADLPPEGGDFRLQESITIPLTAGLFKILNPGAAEFPFNAMERTDINLGTLTVEGGKVLYNGRPLTGEQMQALSEKCSGQERAGGPLEIAPETRTGNKR